MRALNLLRPSLHYRREAFDAGLRAAGFDVVERIDRPGPDDLVITWNAYAGFGEIGRRFEQCGAQWLVAENGCLSKTWAGGEWFSLALGGIAAGGGAFPEGGPERWDSWGVELAPYRTGGDETVIFGQRSIGAPGVASPYKWAENTQRRVGGRIRQHPGNAAPTVALADDLKRASECFTWNSGAALHALLLGVPVWSEGPWIGASAARPLSQWGKAEPNRDEAARLEMFRRLAWAQWTLDEIRTGEPIRRLVEMEGVTA